jgi:hypothetical protein
MRCQRFVNPLFYFAGHRLIDHAVNCNAMDAPAVPATHWRHRPFHYRRQKSL